MKKKTALVLSGGGMKASYHAGAVTALAELGITEFDIVLAGSGGTGSAAYFVAKQIEQIERCFKYLGTKRFINKWRFWNVVDAQYLTEFIFSKGAPLDTVKIRTAKTELQIPLMNAQTGDLHYFSNHEGIDILEVIKASHSMPFLAKPVRLGDAAYIDSFEASYPWFQIERARQLGATKIVVINCIHELPRKAYSFEELIYRFRPHHFRRKHKHYHEKMMNHINAAETKDICYIAPSRDIRCGDFTVDPDRLMYARTTGRGDVLDSNVREFLSKDDDTPIS